MLDAAARSVVKVLAGSLAVEAASWLAAGAEVPTGTLLGEGDFWLDEAGAVASFAGALLGLAGGIVCAAPLAASLEAEDGAALEGTSEIGTTLPFLPAGTQPGTRAPSVALVGPSVIGLQPGNFWNRMPVFGSTFSRIGFGAEHALFSSSV